MKYAKQICKSHSEDNVYSLYCRCNTCFQNRQLFWHKIEKQATQLFQGVYLAFCGYFHRKQILSCRKTSRVKIRDNAF